MRYYVRYFVLNNIVCFDSIFRNTTAIEKMQQSRVFEARRYS